MPQNALASAPVNALAPTAPIDTNPYIASLLQRAAKEYPFIQRHSPMVVMGEGEGYAETWPIGETGPRGPTGKITRPTAIPLNRLGVEIRRPTDFTHHDLAGEVLHTDPYARAVSKGLAKTWTPAQLEVLKREALDYQASLDYGQPETRAIQNATDAALRGYVVGQWPEEVNAALSYTPQQRAMLDALKAYTRTGKR